MLDIGPFQSVVVALKTSRTWPHRHWPGWPHELGGELLGDLPWLKEFCPIYHIIIQHHVIFDSFHAHFLSTVLPFTLVILAPPTAWHSSVDVHPPHCPRLQPTAPNRKGVPWPFETDISQLGAWVLGDAHSSGVGWVLSCGNSRMNQTF